MRFDTTEMQTQGLLDVPSKNLIGKEHFRTQMSMKKLFLIELFLIFLVTPIGTIACNDKDLPLFNKRRKTLIQEKNATYKTFRHNKDNLDLIYRLKFLRERLSTFIESSKERC